MNKNFQEISARNLTIISPKCDLGMSLNCICFTATVSPVDQFKALYTLPKAPFPRQSPI